ncbi:MAG: transcription elongation factor GreA [Alphaproteobacteria bacterium]|nr:transcription elongation factor GreA [Alphaproteobacteria bacterium]MCB9791634.1 transcription elongation factor GreA [Alphaproteobacteria bacterium]
MLRNLITPEGHQRLLADLKHHKSVLRPEVVQQIAEARAHGDLSENAEYDAAKERQGMVEARIRHLEVLAATAEVVDVTKLKGDDKVRFGTTVTLLQVDSDEEVSYRIVSDYEADVSSGSVSYKTPLGQALVGKEEGEEVVVVTPGGKRTYEILSVEYK